jgi:replication factor C subunit 3/5
MLNYLNTQSATFMTANTNNAINAIHATNAINSTPWVEKYRPTNFNDIVLDPLNKLMMRNIIETGHFPNLLFYGPPGTGKTTTIMNLVNEYQMATLQHVNSGLMIHLNASDERGIDIIRVQINSFVTTKSLFGTGTKFVILDEVDYMTKNAQMALRHLLNSYNYAYSQHNVRFCLICNYISRIDEALQTEFVRMRFNQLPVSEINQFLMKVSLSEGLNLSDDMLRSIQKQFNSDIRSMINYMQTNQDVRAEQPVIITDSAWNEITHDLKTGGGDIIDTTRRVCDKINNLSRRCNSDRKNMMKSYINHLIRQHPELITRELLNTVENAMHVVECNTDHLMHYLIINFAKCFRSQSTNGPFV